MQRRSSVALLLVILLFFGPAFSGVAADSDLNDYDRKVLAWANACRQQVVQELEGLVQQGKLQESELFDTFYVPIPGTAPQKFHTRYDRLTDKILQPLLDNCLQKDDRLAFVVLVDRNGYLPTHNTRYTRPLTGDREYDTKWNRAKRLFNDRTGLAAAQNTQDYLVQRYERDTGERMVDLSVPILIKSRHWGALRIAYRP